MSEFRYKVALEEMHHIAIEHGWTLYSDERGYMMSLIENTLNVRLPLKFMRKGKWIPACQALKEKK